MKKLLSILILLAGIINCSTAKNTKKSTMKSKNQVYWVNSTKVPCEGVAQTNCLQVQKNDVINPNQWQLFYSEIIGFKYEEGYIYKIEVKEEHLPENEVPADASTIQYTLVKIISKEAKKENPLHDTWTLATIQGENIELGKSKRPQLNFNLNTMQVSGTDGCNQLFGGIKIVEKKIDFGAIASTKKLCPDMMKIPNAFTQQLYKVSTYTIENSILTLFDKDGKDILSFKKTD